MNGQLREILATVFNLESPETLNGTDSLIDDLGADSLDFVELLHLIERNFGVVLKSSEIMLGGSNLTMEDLFMDGRLTGGGAQRLGEAFEGKRERLREGMTKLELFSLLTVADLEAIIKSKSVSGGERAQG